MSEVKEVLKNCPFCGAFPENVFGTIMCNYCGVKIEGVDKWNRRPASGSPLPVELDNQAIRAIIYMQLDHEDTYSDLLLIENQSAKNCFNAISKMCADEICSRFSQKKVTKDDILEAMRPIPSMVVPIYRIEGKKYYNMCKEDIADKILDHLYPKEKK